jgi:hypothetical protein
MILARGTLPPSLKESTTVALRKEGKKDYSLPSSFRPIALENSLAKLVERAVTNRISDAAETHGLLPWNRMGARRQRSTLSAISLVTSCIEAAWKTQPGAVVSILSLDLSGTFDNGIHTRLLNTLQRQGFPEWTTNLVASFLQERRTRIAYAGHLSDWIIIESGIPLLPPYPQDSLYSTYKRY